MVGWSGSGWSGRQDLWRLAVGVFCAIDSVGATYIPVVFGTTVWCVRVRYRHRVGRRGVSGGAIVEISRGGLVLLIVRYRVLAGCDVWDKWIAKVGTDRRPFSARETRFAGRNPHGEGVCCPWASYGATMGVGGAKGVGCHRGVRCESVRRHMFAQRARLAPGVQCCALSPPSPRGRTQHSDIDGRRERHSHLVRAVGATTTEAGPDGASNAAGTTRARARDGHMF